MGIFDFFKPNVEKLKARKDVDGLIKALKYKRHEYIQREAARALRDIGDEAVPHLIQALKDETPIVRNFVANILGEIGDARAVEPLIMTLKDEDTYIRKEAAESLGNMRDARAVEPLIMTLEDENPDVRKKAAKALGKMRDARAVESLIRALKDGDDHVRRMAIYALGEIGDARYVEPIIRALKDENPVVRKKAAEVLGKMKEPRALEALNTIPDIELKKMRGTHNIKISEYSIFYNKLADSLRTSSPDIIDSKHRAYCAQCKIKFTQEALSHLYLFGPRNDFRGSSKIMGASREGNDIRAGRCPYCGSYNMNINVD